MSARARGYKTEFVMGAIQAVDCFPESDAQLKIEVIQRNVRHDKDTGHGAMQACQSQSGQGVVVSSPFWMTRSRNRSHSLLQEQQLAAHEQLMVAQREHLLQCSPLRRPRPTQVATRC